ncbi:hypothetical protein BH20ACI1_BH20ACI1_05490 [soil metagenome]
MDKRLAVLCFLVGIAMMVMGFPDGFAASILVVVCSAAIIFFIRVVGEEDTDFLVNLFILALLARLAFGLFIQVYDLQDFFGGDALTYDLIGQRLIEVWFGNNAPMNDALAYRIKTSPSGWGMYYLVGAVYSINGRNLFAAQSFCAVIGAATMPLVFICALKIYNNRRVAKMSALVVALYPAFVIWSAQLLKDGLVIFLLVLAMTLVLRLQEKFNYFDVILLGLSLFGMTALRFYIFYMASLAIVGAFIIGTSNTPKAMIKRLALLSIIGIGLAYVGVTRNAESEVGEFANLERIQTSRKDLATSADSGYGKDLDVSTVGGALTAFPIGLTYLLLAPFPWEMTNLRQFITLPEVILWWTSLPFLISGLLYTIRNRLRESIPILVFALILTLAYSIFLGNVGTAYRQRTQIQVFLFMFTAVGWTLRKERKENALDAVRAKRRLMQNRLKLNT